MAHHFFHDYLLHISEGYSHGVTLAHLAEDKRPLFNIKYSIHFEMFTCCLINVTCTHMHTLFSGLNPFQRLCLLQCAHL